MGRSKKQTVGHRYYLGLHFVMCRQADALLEILMATKRAWRGSISSGQGNFNKPDLFGGDEREGGISGTFDFLPGDQAQPVNDYLSGVLGPLVSAYRGVVSIVMRRPYIGANSARVPPMKFKMFNLAGIHKGWLPDLAPINVEAFGQGSAVYIAWNVPGSMTSDQLAASKAWLRAMISSLNGGTTPIYLQRFGVETSDATSAGSGGGSEAVDYTGVLSFIDDTTVPTDPGTESDWNAAFASAPAFFAENYSGGPGAFFPTGNVISSLGTTFRKLISSESDVDSERSVVILLGLHDPFPDTIATAQATLETIPNLEVYAFKIDSTDVADYELIDNTPIDGVPTVDSTNPSANSFLASALLLGWADANPAHIIRNLWTDPMRGGTATEAEIGDSFETAAQLFFDEGLGLSPRFNGGGAIEADRLDVERHADCISYRSRNTGKIEIKPIRNDYVIGDLPVLNSAIVLEWGNLEREIASETPNQLTVIYTKRADGETASVTRTNIAGVRRAGRVIPGEPVQYPSCTVESLATRLCLRDLSVQVRPLLNGTLVLAYFPPELDIGEPFIINEPKLLIDNVVVRIIEVQEGDGQDNSVTVKVSEDRYTLPADAGVVPGTPAPPTVINPLPSPVRVVQEAPYYIVVLDQGQEFVDEALVTDPAFGALMASGTKATPPHRDITIGIDDGSGYRDAGPAEFLTETIILNDLTSAATDDVITVPVTAALASVTENSLALIGEEIIRIDGMTENGTDVDIAIGRGCLDTVPRAHAANATVVFLQNIDPLDEQFLATDVINVKLITNLNSISLSLLQAPEDVVTFDSRAIRPYPPGALQVNGSYAQDQFVADIVLTWAHRDRTIQTTPIPEDHTAGNIGPEAGTTYNVVVDAMDENDLVISNLLTTNVGAVTTYDWNDATALPDGTNRLRFSVASERDSYDSWQAAQISTAVLFSVNGLTIQLAGTDVELTWIDMNSGAMQEDDVVIYRDTAEFDLSTLPTALATLAADTETYTDTTAAPSTSYFYAVVVRRGSLVAARFYPEFTT